MKKLNNRPVFLLLPLFAFLLLFLGVGLMLPVETQALPRYGFTPIPPPTPTPDSGDGDDSATGDTDDADYILVQIEQCDTECAEGFAEGNDASVASSAIQSGGAQTEVLFPVRLIHRGSGWISEVTLSTLNPSRIEVPYPGIWDVYLLESPFSGTSVSINSAGTNLAQLQAGLSAGPVSMGTIEANTTVPLMVKCPIVCVLPPPDVPTHLPTTGADTRLFGIGTVFILTLLAILLVGAVRPVPQRQEVEK